MLLWPISEVQIPPAKQDNLIRNNWAQKAVCEKFCLNKMKVKQTNNHSPDQNPYPTPYKCLHLHWSSQASINSLGLLGLSKTDSIITQVIDRVVSSQECITQYGEGPYGLREVHTHEGANTRTLNFKNVVIGSDGEVVTSKGEGEIWERVALLAFNAVLSIESLLGSNFLVQELSQGGWERNERSSGVDNSSSVLELSSRLSKGYGLEFDLPVSLSADGELNEFALIMGLIDTTENSLTLIILIAEVEGKNRLIKKTLIDHLVEGRNDVVD